MLTCKSVIQTFFLNLPIFFLLKQGSVSTIVCAFLSLQAFSYRAKNLLEHQLSLYIRQKLEKLLLNAKD